MNVQVEGSVTFRRCFVALFVIAVICLLIQNFHSWRKLSDVKLQQSVMQSELEDEKVKANELDSLEFEHKKLVVGYQMLELELKRLYKNECKSLDDFIPVFEDRIVTSVVDTGSLSWFGEFGSNGLPMPVSYTHLTLPTICSV